MHHGSPSHYQVTPTPLLVLSSDPHALADLDFSHTSTRDEAWERTYSSYLEQAQSILASPSPLVEAARPLVSAGCLHAVAFAEQCMKWATEHYPDHALAVATCRWWTSGRKEPPLVALYGALCKVDSVLCRSRRRK